MLTVLSQIDVDCSPGLDAAIHAVPYSNSVKVGLEFKRRFWEEEEAIYGGISFTDRESLCFISLSKCLCCSASSFLSLQR